MPRITATLLRKLQHVGEGHFLREGQKGTATFCSSLLTSGLNLTHHLAEYFLACQWVYRHSLSPCCSIPTVRRDCHLLSTENSQESAPQWHPTCRFGSAQPERSNCFIPCPSPTVRVGLNTNYKGMPASPLACPSFSQSLIDSSDESHKLS